jgi:hypothetical protein
MKAEEWALFRVVADRTEADRIAVLLESSGVPAYVDHGALGMGLDGGYKIFVAGDLVHRARWLTADAAITDEELDFLATGKLPNSNE